MTLQDVRAPSWSQCLGIELADAAVGADDEGEGEGVPVFVGVGWGVAGGGEGGPVFAVVAGDVGAVGAYGDLEFLRGVGGYGGAVAVGWGLGRLPIAGALALSGCIRIIIRL